MSVFVIDTRINADGGLIKGSYWTHANGAISGWISMVSKAEDAVLLVTDEGKGEEILERLLRIGYFNILGYNNFLVSDYPG